MSRPLDAYRAKLQLVQWLRGSRSVDYYAALRTDKDPHDRRQQAKSAAALDAGLLASASTYSVTDEMSALIAAAALNAPAEALRQSDLPAPQGFVYFERPIPLRLLGTDGAVADVRAFQWEQATVSPVLEDGRSGSPTPAIEIMPYMDSRSWSASQELADQGLTMPPLVPVPFVIDQWWLNEAWRELVGQADPDDPVYEVSPEQAAARRILWTFFRLTFQKIAALSSQPLDRSTYRQAQRSGITAPPRSILIVRLRRQYRPQDDDESAAPGNWTHRWVVKGFWRDQWYPSLGRHQSIYIHDYVKGPAHLPLVLKDRIYSLER